MDEVEQTQENDLPNAKVFPGALQKPPSKKKMIKSPKLMNKKEVSVDDATQDPEEVFPTINNKAKISTEKKKQQKQTPSKKKSATIEDRTQEEKVLVPVSTVPPTQPSPAAPAPVGTNAVAVKKEETAAGPVAPTDEKKKEKNDSGSVTPEAFTPASKTSVKNEAIKSNYL